MHLVKEIIKSLTSVRPKRIMGKEWGQGNLVLALPSVSRFHIFGLTSGVKSNICEAQGDRGERLGTRKPHFSPVVCKHFSGLASVVKW